MPDPHDDFVTTRRAGDDIIIGDAVVTILRTSHDSVKVAVKAPRTMPVRVVPVLRPDPRDRGDQEH